VGQDRMRDGTKTLIEEVTGWADVTGHPHRFGGTEFRVGAREIGHVHWFGIVDIPFTVKIRDALIRAGRAEQHHWIPDSGWTTVRLKEHGTENAIQLLRLAYLRVRLKSADEPIARAALTELESGALEPELLEALGIVTAVAKG
jgi:hypothetical protein